jgi:hypothetical protein
METTETGCEGRAGGLSLAAVPNLKIREAQELRRSTEDEE